MRGDFEVAAIAGREKRIAITRFISGTVYGSPSPTEGDGCQVDNEYVPSCCYRQGWSIDSLPHKYHLRV